MPTRFRFTCRDDIELLNQILNQLQMITNNTFSSNNKSSSSSDYERIWSDVSLNLKSIGMQVEPRTVKDRFNLIYKKYYDEDLNGLRRGCSELEYKEKEKLLEQISIYAKTSNHFGINIIDGRVRKRIKLEYDGLESNNSIKHALILNNETNIGELRKIDSTHSSSDLSDQLLDNNINILQNELIPNHTNANDNRSTNKTNITTIDSLIPIFHSFESQRQVELKLREKSIENERNRIELDRQLFEYNKSKDEIYNQRLLSLEDLMLTQVNLLKQLTNNQTIN